MDISPRSFSMNVTTLQESLFNKQFGPYGIKSTSEEVLFVSHIVQVILVMPKGTEKAGLLFLKRIRSIRLVL